MSSLRILTYFFGLSGWLIVATMSAFVIMIHKSMKEVEHPEQDKLAAGK
jgi:hypothetical protein